MNINLSGSKKKAGKSLGFGLNKRSKKPKSNVFDDDGDESSDGGNNINNEQDDKKKSKKDERDAVNREIAAEQEALRNRAKKAMAAASGDSLYDYDGAYDSFNPKKGTEKESQKDESPKKSRYIQDLMKQAEKRNVERDAIYERKVAREQEEEDAQADFRGKEKFVTKGMYHQLVFSCAVL